MTKKQIEKKAKEMANKYPAIGVNSRLHREIYAAAMEMAEWAHSNQWVRVEDELPPEKERYSKYVIMRNRIGGHYIGCYDFEEKLWLCGNLEDIYMDVTHWMPIPPMAEEGGWK